MPGIVKKNTSAVTGGSRNQGERWCKNYFEVILNQGNNVMNALTLINNICLHEVMLVMGSPRQKTHCIVHRPWLPVLVGPETLGRICLYKVGGMLPSLNGGAAPLANLVMKSVTNTQFSSQIQLL